MGESSDEAPPTEAGPTVIGAEIDETEARTAWSLDDEEDWLPPRRMTPGSITALAVAASVVVIVAAGLVVTLKLGSDPGSPAATTRTTSVSSPVTTVPSATAPPVSTTPVQPMLEGADADFIAELRGYGVPVSDEDPEFDIGMAHSICSLVDEQPAKYPRGTSTMLGFVEGVMINNPSWSRQQATRFTEAATRHYCPEASGPTQDEIASMAPDDRFLAILQDRYGITFVGRTAVEAAPYICTWKSQGWTDDQVMNAIDSANTTEAEQAIVDTAVSVYCPRYG